MKRLLGTGLFVAVLLLGISCSGGGGGSDTGGTVTPPGAFEEGTLRLVGPDPLTLDPALTGDAGSATYIEEIFGGLLTPVMDAQGNLVIEPDLAEEVPDAVQNTDGTVSYTFTIRDNAMFHSGRKVTADDVVYSLERALELGYRGLSSTAELYLSDIVGARDKIRGRVPSASGIELVDEHTVRITIDAAKPYFLWKLTYPTSFVVDRTQVESNPRNWTRRPNGTGPFKLDNWDLGREIVLTKNDAFHLGAPLLEKVVFFLAGGSSLTMYEVGDIDVSGVGLADIDRVHDQNDPLSKEYMETPSLDVFYVSFNTKKAPFDDPKVRQAFAHAIDKQALVGILLKNEAILAEGVLPPGMPGYRPDFKGLGFDPDKAKQLLRESSYGSADALGRITLTVSGDGATAGPAIEYIIEEWRKNLGVDVEIEQIEYATFLEDVKRGKFQMFSLGWIADYPDPEDFLDLKFHSDRDVANRESQYENAEVDRLLEQARVEQNHARRMGLYQQAEDIIVEEAPWIPLIHGKNNIVVKPYVKGYQAPPMIVPILRFVSIER